jgi:cell division protein FtsZ
MVRPGIINLDFADVETVMASMGKAMMGTGEAEGEGRAMKAAEMAISNPLIDDYTLKGAKGLLVNITGGKDLKLFEVDEVVNKIRAEVDAEAEVIIGAITDASLDGKIRVSIVATSLDGQQPESKSVINMVHRIQNRNPGYSDFTQPTTSPAFNFSNSMSGIVTEGANALKLDHEIMEQSESNILNNEAVNEQTISTKDNEIKNIVEESSLTSSEQSFAQEAVEGTIPENIQEEEASNGLEDFKIDEETPEFFNSDENNDSANDFSSLSSQDSDSEEDDLEIPAFLRRQKN